MATNRKIFGCNETPTNTIEAGVSEYSQAGHQVFISTRHVANGLYFDKPTLVELIAHLQQLHDELLEEPEAEVTRYINLRKGQYKKNLQATRGHATLKDAEQYSYLCDVVGDPVAVTMTISEWARLGHE